MARWPKETETYDRPALLSTATFSPKKWRPLSWALGNPYHSSESPLAMAPNGCQRSQAAQPIQSLWASFRDSRACPSTVSKAHIIAKQWHHLQHVRALIRRFKYTNWYTPYISIHTVHTSEKTGDQKVGRSICLGQASITEASPYISRDGGGIYIVHWHINLLFSCTWQCPSLRAFLGLSEGKPQETHSLEGFPYLRQTPLLDLFGSCLQMICGEELKTTSSLLLFGRGFFATNSK